MVQYKVPCKHIKPGEFLTLNLSVQRSLRYNKPGVIYGQKLGPAESPVQ